MGPTTSAWSPPDNGPETVRRCVCRIFSLPCVRGCVRSRVCFLCIMHIKTVCSRFRPAKRRAQNLQGTRFIYVYFCFCYLGGGSLDGGDHVSPRCLGPSRSTPEGCGAAHGPRHPAYPLLLRPVISSWGFRFLFLLGFWVRLGLFAQKQRFFVCFFVPFKTRPLLECLFGSLFFSLVVWLFFCPPSSSVSLSPLQVLGKHKLRCSLCCTRPSPSTRTSCTAFSSRSPPRRLFVLVWFRCRRLALSLSLSLFLSLV